MANDQFQFDTAQGPSPLDFVEGIRKAKECGKGMVSMIREIAKLRMGQGKLRPDEYFMYGLYDDNRYSWEAKQSFLSQDRNMLESPWAKIAKDKPLLTAMLSGLGLPVPDTQAIVHPTRTFAGAKTLRDRDQVSEFLRNDANYPIFGKPFDSKCSMGTAKITRYDSQRDALLMGGDQWIPVDGFTEMIQSLGHDYLFQTLLLPHSEIENLIGASVSSVRMFVISDDEGCSLFRAAWKIPASVNDADNFWRAGNILAAIDIDSGKIQRTLVRTEDGSTEAIEAHPLTEKKFSEMQFPMWNEMRETVLSAAVNLPECHFQGWDVALTDRGPILVELEGDGGNPIMEQICFDSGLLTERYLRIVEQAEQEKQNRRNRDSAQDQAHFFKSMSALALPTTDVSPSDEEADGPSDISSPIVVPVTTSPVDAPSTTNS